MPVISTDYMGLTKKEPEEGVNPIIVLVDRKTKMKHPNVIKNKEEPDHDAIERMGQDITIMGCGHFVLNSDQEPALLSLKETVTRRITTVKGAGVQIFARTTASGGKSK